MKKFDVFDLVGNYHYKQVASNQKYRETINHVSKNWTEEDRNKFVQFLKDLEAMNEENNKE